MDGRSVALVFANPAHEILGAGLMQRYRPHLLFVTRSDSGGESGREELAQAGLERLGLADRATFLGLSEGRSYAWARDGEVAGYLEVRDRIADWLGRVRPSA